MPLVPGCEGSGGRRSGTAKFLVGEKQGDPTLLEIGREEDPDDPMACMHEPPAKCAGCGPIEILRQIPAEEAGAIRHKRRVPWGASFFQMKKSFRAAGHCPVRGLGIGMGVHRA